MERIKRVMQGSTVHHLLTHCHTTCGRTGSLDEVKRHGPSNAPVSASTCSAAAAAGQLEPHAFGTIIKHFMSTITFARLPERVQVFLLEQYLDGRFVGRPQAWLLLLPNWCGGTSGPIHMYQLSPPNVNKWTFLNTVSSV